MNNSVGGRLTYTTHARTSLHVHPPRAHATTRQFDTILGLTYFLTTLLKGCLFVNIGEEWGFFSSMALRMNGNHTKNLKKRPWYFDFNHIRVSLRQVPRRVRFKRVRHKKSHCAHTRWNCLWAKPLILPEVSGASP
jgi:hypothetical protein